jgi:hypothetical protein
MSSLIQRMIQRAKGDLPGIEPLLLPRYARGRDAAGEALPHLEEGYADQVSVTATNSRMPSTEVPVAAAQRPHPQLEERSIAQPAKEAVREPEARTPSRKPDEGRPSIFATASVGRKISDRAEQVGPTREVVMQTILRDEKHARVGKDPREASAEQTVASPRAQRERPHAASALSKQDLRKDAGSPDIAVQARPVTISIGHIEVRAPQAPAAAPRRPAFKPSVSLAQYLKGEGGARS